MVLLIAHSCAQARETITGRVLDAETGEPIEWCSGLEHSGHLAFLTDSDGRFTVTVVALPAEFVLSHVSYKSLTIAVTKETLTRGELAFRLQPRVYKMETVEVTADRFSFVPERSPAPVSIISHDRIARENPINLGEMLTAVPGVEVSKTGPWSTKPVIRGMGGDRVLVLVDGHRLNQAQGHGAEPSMVDVESIERIEIYRGSASALYGSDAMGGVINIVTQPRGARGDRAPLSGSVKLLGRSADEQAYGRLDLHGVLGRANWDLGLSARSVGTLHTPDGTVGNTDFDDLSGDITVDIPFRAEDRLRLSLQHYRAHDVGIPIFNDAQESSGRFPLKQRSLIDMSYELTNAAPWLSTARASVWAQEIDSEFREVIVDSLFFRKIHVGWINSDRKGDSRLQSMGARLEATAVPLQNLAVTVGAEMTQEDAEGVSRTAETHMNLEWEITAVEEDSVASMPDARRVNLSAFLQGELELGPRILFTLGLRHDSAGTETWETPGSSVEPCSKDVDRTSVKLGSKLQVTDELAFTGSLGTGFKIPTLQELYFNDVVHGSLWVFGNEDLVIEDALTADIGARFAADRLSARVDLFRTWADNLIAVKYIGMLYLIPRFQYVNVTEAMIQGVEAELAWGIRRNLEARCTFSWLMGDDLTEPVEFGVPESTPLPSMPPPKGTVQLTYMPSWNWGPLSEFWIEPQLRIVGDRTRVALEEPTSPGFVIWNLRTGSHVGESSEVTLSVENVANRAYREPLSFVDEAGRNFIVAWRTCF